MTIAITEVRNAASLQSDNFRMDVEINHPCPRMDSIHSRPFGH